MAQRITRITRGNNVHAYEDINHDNITGYSPDTFNLRFDYPFTPSITPTVNLASCITNLFYWNNIMHDVTYQYGFDEVSGNFQNNNLGRGGLGADYVKAEAQDGGGTNNANFSTTCRRKYPKNANVYMVTRIGNITTDHQLSPLQLQVQCGQLNLISVLTTN